MFIQTEATPNPATLKFLPGTDVLPNGAEDFPNIYSTDSSPLASKLFGIRGVERVFFGHDFISISKGDNIHWEHIKPAILGTIMEHFQAGIPVMEYSQKNQPVEEDPNSPDAPIIKQIKDLLATRVRPAVSKDGGDITFYGFERGVVYLHMKGACAGCPSSTITLKMGIENLLRHYIPEVVEVRPVM